MKKYLIIVLILSSLGARSAMGEVSCNAPAFTSAGAPPNLMMVMGRDHTLYYEAYNDAVDLDDDGILDINYNHSIEYYGYFDPYKCYTYSGSGNNAKFNPAAITTNKFCSGTSQWSGNYLNYISMSRMDVLRKVLYGGHRSTDSASSTVLEGVYIPRDAHSWAKTFTGKLCTSGSSYANMCSADSECQSGYTCSSLPSGQYLIDQTLVGNTPSSGSRHLFCVTSTTQYAPHVIRIGKNTNKMAWEWASKESPVCDSTVPSTKDLVVRAEVCKETAGLEANCQQYKDTSNNPLYKPIGILQEFGEVQDGSKVCSKSLRPCNGDNDCNAYPGSYGANGLCLEKSRMYYGLLTGSYAKNLKGGVLRKNIWSIGDELVGSTGMFKTSENVPGNIINTIEKFKIVDYSYSGNSYSNCGWITDGSLSTKSDGTCRMWGNPIGEMLYETLRYFAGKGSATSDFAYGSTSVDQQTLGLGAPAWGVKGTGNTRYQPYQLFPWCSKPSILVLSDINNSYDSDQVPGSYFKTYTGDLSPALNVQELARKIGNLDSDNITQPSADRFIGESAGSSKDFSCDPKLVSDLSQIRGLCPQEPTKEGSYYPAAVAYYGRTQFSENLTEDVSNVKTYAVAMASPLPEINIKVGSRTVNLVPFGKSVTGSHNLKTNCYDRCSVTYDNETGMTLGNCTTNAYCPTNTIVDFYVTEIGPTSGKFRINFEDVEQGADHDMDAIILFEYEVIDNNSLEIKVKSESAAGSIDQYLGFIISGTNQDGSYLVVRDKDVVSEATANTFVDRTTGGTCSDPYADTCVPYCSRFTTQSSCNSAGHSCTWNSSWNNGAGICYWGGDSNTPIMGTIMRLAWKKTFTVSDSPPATLLKDPLWYTAKWGGFDDINGNGIPDLQNEWDKDGDETPDNYFLVTNALELQNQLRKAFTSILGEAGSASAVATVSPTQGTGDDLVVRGAFSSGKGAGDAVSWKGRLEVYWPYEGCADYLDETTCSQVAGCVWKEGSPGECTGKLYSFQKGENQFCNEDHCWEAATLLNELIPSSPTGDTGRCIFTLLNDNMTLFGGNFADCPSGLSGITEDNEAIKAALENTQAKGGIDFNDNGTIDDADAEDLISWIRGNTYYDQQTAHDRDEWILGDIVYSTPLIVGAPTLSSVPATVSRENCTDDCLDNSTQLETCAQDCFLAYRELYGYGEGDSRGDGRDKMVYVGANDGMLHAFIIGEWDDQKGEWVYEKGEDPDGDNDKVGDELWAYIPGNLLPELKAIAKATYGTDVCLHRAMVDLSPESWDVYIDHDGNGSREWRTVLLGGERGGGDVYFAIDVTDPKAPRVLWEYPVFRNMVVAESSTSFSMPFRNKSRYGQVSMQPVAFSMPYVGRLMLADPLSTGGFRFQFKALDTISSSDPADSEATSLGESDFGAWEYSETAGGTGKLGNWVAFIGSGTHVFDKDVFMKDSNGNSNGVTDEQAEGMMRPYLLAIDIETGINLFQYLWPRIHAEKWQSKDRWEHSQHGGNDIPYTMGNPVALDTAVATGETGKSGQDGYVDHIYVGDLYGNFYGIKFNTSNSSSVTRGMKVDVWKTKPITDETQKNSNSYRTDRQPITVTPVAAFDDDYNLMLYFGTGKFEEVTGSSSDKTEVATMSFYSRKDSATLPVISGGFEVGGFTTEVEFKCDGVDNDFQSGCTWVKSDNVTPDCCQSNSGSKCENGCWTCVLDFTTPGERVVDSALVAGGIIFVTTFVPSENPCDAGGVSFLYALDYDCGKLKENPFRNAGFDKATTGTDQKTSWKTGEYGETETGQGYVVKLGPGMPSRPVLDSTANYVFIQTSDAKIQKIKVELPPQTGIIEGWKRDTTEK